MDEDKDFTVEDSEELMSNLNSNTAPEFEKLRSTLNLLAHVNELSPISTPPILPSQIGHPVQLLTRKSTRSRRTIITSILSVGLLASASLAAAAVTGRGPAPLVSVAHESAKFVKAVAGAVTHAVTGTNSDSHNNPSPNKNKVGNDNNSGSDNGSGNSGGSNGGSSGDGQSGDSKHSLTGPSSPPSSEGDKSNSNSGEKSPNSGSGEKDHSSNDGSRTPTAKPTDNQGSDQSSGDNSLSLDLNGSVSN